MGRGFRALCLGLRVAAATTGRTTTASTRVGRVAARGAAADRDARRRVEQLVQEGELAALGRRHAGFECDDVAVAQSVVLEIGDFSILVEIDGENRTRLDGRTEERDLFFNAGNVIPGVAVEPAFRATVDDVVASVEGNPRRCWTLVLVSLPIPMADSASGSGR